jgi:hypothetical protein
MDGQEVILSAVGKLQETAGCGMDSISGVGSLDYYDNC